MTARLIMMRGVPRSGKSTKAKEIAQKDGNTFIVSRDNLREMMLVGKWNGKKERVIIQAQEAIVRELLAREMNVIVDDTNLTKSHEDKWKYLATTRECKFEIVEMDCVDPVELISRDVNDKDNQRGSHVIMENLLQHKRIGYNNKEIIICDLDGTIADLTHRLHYVKGEGKSDWKSFFEECEKDTLITDVANKIREEAKNGKKIIFVSGRSSSVRSETESWLFKNKFINFYPSKDYYIYSPDSYCGEFTQYEALLMRNENDRRDDDIVKKDILDKYLKKEWIDKVYDDRPRVIRMWKENGLEVVDCGNGMEF